MSRLLIICYLSSFLLFSSCSNGSKNEDESVKSPEPIRDTIEKIVYVEKEPVLTEQQLQERLKEKELKEPLKYVKVSHYSVKPKNKKVTSGGLFKQTKTVRVGDIITGSYSNSATVARFQDPIVTVNWYSIEGNLINTSNTRLYEFIYPQTDSEFEIEVPYVKDATRIDVKITEVNPFIGVRIDYLEEPASQY